MRTKSVAVIGAGAAGAATAAAFAAEEYFDRIRIFERREIPGGTWIYDENPGDTSSHIYPGKLPTSIDPPLEAPKDLPRSTSPSERFRWDRTPIYAELTTNVPEIVMSLSDQRFPYGPFVPHWVPKQYIQDYFARHKTDRFLVLNTTVEDVSKLPAQDKNSPERWKLTLRRFDALRQVDDWWEEEFDIVVIANGHYSVPNIPQVTGLEEYLKAFPERVTHSKSFRKSSVYADKTVLVIGNSASGHDVTTQLVQSGLVKSPVYQSRRSKSRWDGSKPPDGIEWKPVIREYRHLTNEIVFDDGSVLSNIDAIIYATGYYASFPFWNSAANGGPLFDYSENRLLGFYQHFISQSYPRSLGIVGHPRVITFRSFEYQGVALARLFSGRNSIPLPSASFMRKWEKDRVELVRKEHRKFHDIPYDNGETLEWLRWMFEFAGLPRLEGPGRYPPVLDEETRWAYEHVRKYPEPGKEGAIVDLDGTLDEEWVNVVKEEVVKDSFHFI